MIGELIEIPIGEITFPEAELRKQVVFEGLESLANSIRTVGLLNPAVVRRVGERWELVAGWRRLKACEMIGMASIPCRVAPPTEELADLARIHENIFREDVNPVDEGEFYRTLLKKYQWNISTLALNVKRSPAYVSNRINIIDADEEVKEAMRDGKIGISIAMELTRIDDPGNRKRLLWYAINSGATLDTVRRWRVDYETSRMREHALGEAGKTVLPEEIVKSDAGPPKLKDATTPEMEIEEKVREFRTCFGCGSKVDIDSVFVMFLCPGCKDTIVGAIHPQKKDITTQEKKEEVKDDHHVDSPNPQG